ncbi:hypothetical protein M1437_00745, partial [Patescibacteria group bacterium]|nr:hypothetical protein [Patescibacteria group bacterium]
MARIKKRKRAQYKPQYQKIFLQIKLPRPRVRFLKAWSILRAKFHHILAYIKNNPIRSFIYTLIALIVLILISNFLFSPKALPISNKAIPKEVQVFRVGTSAKVTVQAQIEKAGVVKINALTTGVVWAINA